MRYRALEALQRPHCDPMSYQCSEVWSLAATLQNFTPRYHQRQIAFHVGNRAATLGQYRVSQVNTRSIQFNTDCLRIFVCKLFTLNRLYC